MISLIYLMVLDSGELTMSMVLAHTFTGKCLIEMKGEVYAGQRCGSNPGPINCQPSALGLSEPPPLKPEGRRSRIMFGARVGEGGDLGRRGNGGRQGKG